MKTSSILKGGMLLVVASACCTPAHAQGMFQKAVGKIAKMSGKIVGQGMLFGTTDNLAANSPGIAYRSSVYPKKVGVLETDLFGKGWVDGGDQIMISIVQRRGIKMRNLQGGSITVDGQPATFQDLGIYTYAMPHNNEPHKVEITAANGEKSSFTIQPLADQPRIVSINGQTGDNPEVDLSKDVTIELSNPGLDDGSRLQVMITASKIGLNTFYEVGNFKPTSKLVIPAEAFANTAFPSSGGVSLKNCYIMVSRAKFDKAGNTSGQYKNIPIISTASDGRFINVTSKPDFTDGIKSEGEFKGGKRKMEWSLTKEEAALSRPFSQAKKVGVVAFGTRGVASAEAHDDGRLSGVQTDAWASFTPSDAFLDALNAELYKNVVAITKELTGGQIIEPEKVAATKAWEEANLMSETDDGTKTSYAKAYKTGKIPSEAAIGVSFRPITDGQTMAEEAGADALLRCVFDLSVSIDKGGQMYLTPILRYQLYGKPGGINIIPTKFVEGTVQTKDLKVSKKTTDGELMEMIALPDMMAALRQGLMDLKQKEAAAPYEKLWSMQ